MLSKIKTILLRLIGIAPPSSAPAGTITPRDIKHATTAAIGFGVIAAMLSSVLEAILPFVSGAPWKYAALAAILVKGFDDILKYFSHQAPTPAPSPAPAPNPAP